ncbi:phosphodiester glycosidase family protein [Allosphingosinicella indica]|uniref:Uncharacterized protein YigE, DUF2233 family n=1 Tax=Allosphingosinicella indica TaxID=941907 RepID=A0A1X7GIL7_9SPHN|nr:phosphodiester glycosidase family protein [Allosphingosinicella indica]SMF69609.1 Uncharacterized protein YigE, DUF2233 family [Allosphingosinicella indica]
MAVIRFRALIAAALGGMALLAAWLALRPAPQPDVAPRLPDFVTAPPACETQAFEGSHFTVCRYNARRDEFRLILAGEDGQPLRSLKALEQALGPDAASVRFAMNGGMFDDFGQPIGLYVEDGTEGRALNLKNGAGNFHLMPNGVFAIDSRGAISITPSERFRTAVKSPRWATQSGPMLVIDDAVHPRFEKNGRSLYVRNGVGVRDAATAFFVISEEGVSFGRFARFFRDALGCPNALYLDGSVSSLWNPAAGRRDAYSRLGPMIVVSRKP